MAPPIPLSVGRRRLGGLLGRQRWLVLAAMLLLIATVGSVSSWLLMTKVEQQSAAAVATNQLDASVDAMRASLSEIDAERRFTAAGAVDYRAARGELTRAELAAATSGVRDRELTQLLVAADHTARATDAEFTRLQHLDRWSKSQRSSRLDHVFDAFDAAAHMAVADMRHQAAKVVGWARAGMIGLIALEALGLLVLLRRDASVRRAVAVRDATRTADQRYESLLAGSSDLTLVVGEGGAITYMSQASERLLGYPPADLLGGHMSDLIHPDDLPSTIEIVLAILAGAASQPVVSRLRHRNGQWRAFESLSSNMFDDPVVQGIVWNCRDITDRCQLEDQLSHQALHDPLTDLPNRTLFMDRLSQALAVKRREPHREVTVLSIDLDHFKLVNDGLGHAAGDELLILAAHRLLSTVRPGDTVARFGGDEFVVLLEDDPEPAGVTQRIIDVLHQRLTIGTTDLQIPASIGIASAQEPTTQAEDLVRDADAAMYVAKGQRRGSFAEFQPDMHHQATDRLELATDLHGALERGELFLEYQPTVSLADTALEGFEALIRWSHPRRGLIGPDAFIGIAEETGDINAIGHWVIRQACRQLRDWTDSHPGIAHLMMNVNISSRQLRGDALVAEVAAALRDFAIEPHRLVLELTEGVLIDDSPAIRDQLAALKDLGVQLAIDDFGTGYASLTYLRQFPVDIVKIDKSFVDTVLTTDGGAAFVQAIVQLAAHLNLRTIAEGIETSDQVKPMTDLGCDAAQGYYFARPASPQIIETMLNRAHECVLPLAHPRPARRAVPVAG